MIIKLFSFLRSPQYLHYESCFFKNKDDGHIIYYPWAYPGEGYLITEALKRILLRFFTLFEYGLYGSFIILIMLAFLNVLQVDHAIFCILGMSMLSTFLYLMLLYMISKKAVPYILPDQDRPAKDRSSNSYLWFAIMIQILGVTEIISSQNFSAVTAIAFFISGMIYCLFLLWLIRTVDLTKGYVFTK